MGVNLLDEVRSHSNRPAQLRLLVLGSEEPWVSAVREELETSASGPQRPVLEAVSNGEEAARRLVVSGHGFTHLLLEPDLAGEWLQTLVGLTSGEDHSGVALVVLGAGGLPGWAPVDAHFVLRPHDGWLADSLRTLTNPLPSDAAPDVEELRAALSPPRLHARYQPIVRMSDRVPVGLEALARFDHPFRGTLRPDLFIPQIEAAGLAWTLTQEMLELAFSEWSGEMLGRLDMFVAFNVPLDVLLIPEAIPFLEACRAASGIPASRVVVELTESQPVHRVEELAKSITKLHDLGYGLAIDDVGPEIRDHTALLDLRFTMLKLDKDLVRDVIPSEDSDAFLANAIASARKSDLTIVAEGVETAEIWDRMAKAGVDQAQGFLIARPLPAQAVALWRDDWCGRYRV